MRASLCSCVVPTDLDPVWADVKHFHHTRDERTDGLEVEASDAPGAVHQQHDVGLRLGLARHACEGNVHNVSGIKRSEGETQPQVHSQL